MPELGWLTQEPARSIVTAVAGGGVLAAVVRLIERRVPTRETEYQSEQKFRADLLARVEALEDDRDKLAQEVRERERQYWELYRNYTALEQDYKQLKVQHETLLGEVARLRDQVNGGC